MCVRGDREAVDLIMQLGRSSETYNIAGGNDLAATKTGWQEQDLMERLIYPRLE